MQVAGWEPSWVWVLFLGSSLVGLGEGQVTLGQSGWATGVGEGLRSRKSDVWQICHALPARVGMKTSDSLSCSRLGSLKIAVCFCWWQGNFNTDHFPSLLRRAAISRGMREWVGGTEAGKKEVNKSWFLGDSSSREGSSVVFPGEAEWGRGVGPTGVRGPPGRGACAPAHPAQSQQLRARRGPAPAIAPYGPSQGFCSSGLWCRVGQRREIK